MLAIAAFTVVAQEPTTPPPSSGGGGGATTPVPTVVTPLPSLFPPRVSTSPTNWFGVFANMASYAQQQVRLVGGYVTADSIVPSPNNSFHKWFEPAGGIVTEAGLNVFLAGQTFRPLPTPQYEGLEN